MADAEIERIRQVYSSRNDRDRYDPRRPDVIAGAAARASAWGRALLAARHDLGRVIEVGSGTGALARWARECGASAVVGVDVQASALTLGRSVNPAIGYVLADARRLPARDAAFDTAIVSTLFSSVLADEVARAIAAEIDRVLGPRGGILWFDFAFDNPRSRQVRGMRVRAVRELFPGFSGRLERVVLAPPIARRVVGHPAVSAMLERVPLLRTHRAGLLRRVP